MEIEKPSSESELSESFMSILVLGSASRKSENLKEVYTPSQISAGGDNLKLMRSDYRRQSIKRTLLNNLANRARPHTTHSNMQPWGSRRTGKKLLVLDLDQTVCDCGPHLKGKVSAEERRPYLTKFLNTVYEFYDIVIWSATDKLVVLDKIHRLKLFSERSKILFHLDLDDMLIIKLPIKGKLKETRVSSF